MLHRFLGGSVTSGTMKGYEREWRVWTEFVARKSRRAEADPYMRDQSDKTKVLMVCHLFAERHRAGKREKAATGITAAIRKHFALAMESTEWMNAEAIGVGRKSCKRTSQENREYIKAGSGQTRLGAWPALTLPSYTLGSIETSSCTHFCPPLSPRHSSTLSFP